MASIHKRFGDDEDSDDFQDSIPITNNNVSKHSEVRNDQSDSGSDSDAAPETVSTSAAISASKDAQRKLTRTLRNMDHKEKAIRKKLDASRVKQTQSRRKAHTEEVEQQQQGQDADKENNNDDEDSIVSENGDDDDDDDDDDDKYRIPEMPSLEVFAAAEEARRRKEAQQFLLQGSQGASGSDQRKRKRKFADVAPKPPKDVRVGNSTFRVLSKPSKTLPPQASSLTGNAKEAWLANRHKESWGGARKTWKSSFIKR